MKIAITGGAGFIGTQLAALLKAQGHEPVLIDIKPSECFPEHSIIANVTDAEALKAAFAGVDAIYHLAAEHRDDVSPIQKYYDVNVGGGENVIAAAKAHDIRTIIFTSSVAVYPLEPANRQTGSIETDTPSPFNDYGHSKLQSEKTFEDWAAQNSSRTLVTVRLVATFGPGNRGNIYTLINQVASGKFMMIGRGDNRKSIAYIGNVAAFLSHCLTLGKTRGAGAYLYNYADKPDLRADEMVKAIRGALGLTGTGPRIPYMIGLAGGCAFDLAAKLTGKTFPISTIRVRKFCANTIVSADKMKETGFEAPYSLQTGLAEMIKSEFAARRRKKAA
ncbi:MAG: NAD-dependent epimerase/dehydratase family protein [Alphaproteobacteria bacterium]